jgi:putative two-component system response regulator
MEIAHPTILVIDDHADTLNLLVDLLESAEYRVESALSATAGLSLLQDTPVDLIVVDLLLPDMSGLEFCEQVRAREQLQLVPIILVSAASGVCSKESSATAGANSYISKPFDINNLLDLVQMHLAPVAALR